MTDLQFRRPDLYQQLPFRDWLRKEMPSGRDGFVAEDLDLVIRTFGASFSTDATGREMLIEIKHGDAPLRTSKIRTFGLLDSLLRQADPDATRYRGFFVIRTPTDDWYQVNTFRVNGSHLTPDQFKAWLSDSLYVAPRDFAS